MDRLVLYLTLALTPVLDLIKPIGDFSLAWFWYAFLLAYTGFFALRSVAATVRQRIFLSALAFILAGVLMETLHAPSDYEYLTRFAQAILGAVLICALCRDRGALLASFSGIVTCGIILSLIISNTSYDSLADLEAEGFKEATRVREQTYQGQYLLRDLNRIGYLCSLGATVAYSFGLGSAQIGPRFAWFSLAIIGFLGGFLTLSRGAVVISSMACLTVLGLYRGHRTRTLLVSIAAAAVLYFIAPKVVFERLSFSNQDSHSAKLEARQRVFRGVIGGFSDYWATGVGARYYMDEWAVEYGIVGSSRRAVGAHNSYFQVWIFWGLPGLLAFLVFLWQAYRCLPKRHRGDLLAVTLYGLFIALLMRFVFMHTFYTKDVSSVLGLLAAARLWVWPRSAGNSSHSSKLPMQGPRERESWKTGSRRAARRSASVSSGRAVIQRG